MQPLEVTIAGRSYTLRSDLPEERIREVAAFVEGQLATTAAAAPSADSYRVAVLTLLNVAGQMFTDRQKTPAPAAAVDERPLQELLERIEAVLLKQ